MFPIGEKYDIIIQGETRYMYDNLLNHKSQSSHNFNLSSFQIAHKNKKNRRTCNQRKKLLCYSYGQMTITQEFAVILKCISFVGQWWVKIDSEGAFSFSRPQIFKRHLFSEKANKIQRNLRNLLKLLSSVKTFGNVVIFLQPPQNI